MRRSTKTPPPSPRPPAAGQVSRSALCALALALSYPAAHAAEPGLVISQAWLRLIIPSRPAAGYFVLSNETGRTRTLVGAASPECGALMLHRSVNDNGQERMEMVDSVSVPAHGEVKFAPGGYHLMCMSPTAALARGRSVSVTLRFEDGGSLVASFPVRGATGD
ncbi:MAG: copper chaperone PCu(A)C [Roseiarcus sp.]